MKTKSNPKNGGFFEELGRWSARHAWAVVMFWLTLLVICAVLYLTMFSKNMTTVLKFTTGNDSQLAENLFAKRFPQAAYDQESCLVSSNKYTADDPEFWAYVDGLYRKLTPLVEQRIVRDVQYYQPLVREALIPLMPAHLEKMIAAMRLVTEGNPTSEQLLQTAADLQASAASLTATVDRLAAGVMTPEMGQMVYDQLIYAADGAETTSGMVLMADTLQKTYGALLPMTQGGVLTAEEREAKVTELKATAARLADLLAYLEATGPGTANRPTLVSGVKMAKEQLPLMVAMYEAKYVAQLGVSLADLFTGAELPTVAQVNTAIAEMQAAGVRLDATIAYLEANVPEGEMRQMMLEQLGAGASQMKMYGSTVMPVLAQALSYIEDPGSGFWGDQAEKVLRFGLGLAKGYMQQQKAIAQDGLRQIQEQTSAQIGQARDGISQMKSLIAQNLPSAVEGKRQLEEGFAIMTGLVSTDKHSTQFVVKMSPDKDEAAREIKTLRKYVLTGDGKGIGEDSYTADGFRVRMMGNSNINQDLQDVALSDLVKSLSVAVPIALVILFIVFGTLGAALLPLALGVVSMVVALGICALVGTWVQIAFAVQNIVALLGLALGIDHALFIAYRYREERRKGRDKVAAIARANGTAGHAIFYAGIVVIISFLGIMFIPCNMHRSLGVGAFTVLFVIIPASITLLPALLSLLGNGFDFGRLPWQKRITDPLPPEIEGKKDFWHWITRPAMRAPIISFILGTAILALVISPFFNMKLSYTNVEMLPPDSVSKSGLEAINQAGYPTFATQPVYIAVDGYDKPAVRGETDALIAELKESGNFMTTIPISVNADGTVAQKMLTLLQDPFTEEAADLIRSLRRDYIGDRFKDAGGEAHVCGPVAMTVDFLKINEDQMDPILTFVLGLRLVLLFLAFRSVLMSVFLTVLSVLSLYAGYGLVVYVFQYGHSFGFYQKVSGIDPYVPFMLMCGLLGISMDYLVFVVSRVRERYDQTGNPPEAIMHAFRRTGFVVMGAAAVMFIIFFAFSISKIVLIGEIGFGMAVAMLVDATFVNFLLSPAVMKILGKWIWWWPSWLNWVPDLRAHPGKDEVDPEENVFSPSYRPAGVPGYAMADSEEVPPQPRWRS